MDSIQAKTSSNHQQWRRLCGILKGRGMRCWYFLLVAHVLIVFSDLWIRAESSSICMDLGMPLLGVAGYLVIFFTIAKR